MSKVVWITGASSGIGEQLVYKFSKEGYQVILSSRKIADLEKVKSNCKNTDNIKLLAFDLGNHNQIETTVKEAINLFGKIDVLINNGGISQRSLAQNSSFEVYEKIFNVNQIGTIKLSQALLPHFIDKKLGHYINVTSIAGVAGLPYRTAYCASKYAVEGYFAALRVELSNKNIDITMIRPGAVKTNVGKNALVADGSQKGTTDNTIEEGLSPDIVANKIYKAYTAKKQFLFIPSSFLERFFYIVNKHFPSISAGLAKRKLKGVDS
ncbi:MAG: SDR family NAD(P)-dependent oxidoreductase [Chitinophagales bacterium]|nr:SDR family NAD(P)-dependent oxidoreductase [Chitinophagales bacterium]